MTFSEQKRYLTAVKKKTPQIAFKSVGPDQFAKPLPDPDLDNE